MLVRQAMLLKSFVEILRSRGVCDKGDVEAFEALVRSQEKADPDIFVSVVAQYRAFAQELGLEGNLPRI